jgi:hypothetical protein
MQDDFQESAEGSEKDKPVKKTLVESVDGLLRFDPNFITQPPGPDQLR